MIWPGFESRSKNSNLTFATMLDYGPTAFSRTREYNSIKNLSITSLRSALSLRANSESKFHTDMYTSKVKVSSDGTLIWNNLVTLFVSCSFDVTWFPVDKQVGNFLPYNLL